MLVKINHPEINQQKTRLSADIAASATSSTVENNDGFAADDYIVFGKPGQENTEIVLCTSVTGNTTIGHTTGPVYAHQARTPLYIIKFNQAQIYRATSQTGTYSLIATVDLDIDEDYTLYDDEDGATTSWYKIRYKDEKDTKYSAYSDVVQGTGYTADSLYDMTSEALQDFGDPDSFEVSRKQVKKYLNAGVRKLVMKLATVMTDYRRQYTTQALTSGTTTYDLPDRCLHVYKVNVNFTGSDIEDSYEADAEDEFKGYLDSWESTNHPKFAFRGDQLFIRPAPTSSSGYYFIWYLDYPEEMDDEIDTHGLPFGAREALVAYAVYRLWMVKNQDKASIYRTEFGDIRDEYVNFVAQSRQSGTNKKINITFGDELYQ